MPLTLTTCLTCGTAFPPNHELASIPDGTRIAFDPAHRRVWRICMRCETWNLLGADAASAALPELVARMPAGDGFAFEKVGGNTELIRVGTDSGSAATAAYSSRLRGQVDKQHKMRRWLFVVAGAGFAMWAGWVVWVSHGSPVVPLGLLVDYSAVFFAGRLTRALRWKSMPLKQSVGPGILTAAAVGALWLVAPEAVGFTAFGAIVIFPLMWFTTGTEEIVRFMKLPLNGREIRMSLADLRRITMAWTADGAITFHDVRVVDTVSGAEALSFGQRVFAVASGMDPGVNTVLRQREWHERAYLLLRASGGMNGLLRALDGFRRTSDGRVAVAELPAVYLIALRLALLEPEDAFDRSMHLQAEQAGRVAVIAEQLESGG